MRRITFTTVAALAAALTLTAACGADESPEATGEDAGDRAGTERSGAGAFPVEIETARGPVTIDEQPERIVSLSATATEMIYAIGAGDQVEAVDEYSNHPEGTPMTELSGYEPNVEAVAGYEPDLVVISYDANDLVAGLEALDVPVIDLPAATTLDDTYEQIATLGDATGHPDEADEVVEGMQADIDELAAQVADRPEPVTYFHELDDQLHTATSDTFIGGIYALAGLENVADEADDGSGYPQVSAELLFDTDPDVFFIADSAGGVTAEKVAARAGYDRLTAVRKGQIIELDPDVASRWGPRTVDLLRTVVEATADIEHAGGS